MKKVLAATALALGLLLGACGGGSETAAPTGPTNVPVKPVHSPASRQHPDLQKSNNSTGGRILGDNIRQTTVFQTRPTPVDPTKK